jgi:uncharacterized protein (DUF2147 family)
MIIALCCSDAKGVYLMKLWAQAIAASLILPSQAMAAAPIAGRWLTDNGKAIVEIAPCGHALCGRVVRYTIPTPNGPPLDKNNPVLSERTRPIMGRAILTSLIDKGSQWEGQVYDPDSGKSYRSKVFRNANGTLTVKGCIAFICKSRLWQPGR